MHEIDQKRKRNIAIDALGGSSVDIAAKLAISGKTAKTQRKNIRRNLNIENNYYLTRFSQACDLI